MNASSVDIKDLFESYTDYFLPSKDELVWVYVNLHVVGKGGFSNVRYWSSSEATAAPNSKPAATFRIPSP